MDKKSGRRRHLANYSLDASGAYVYTGKYYAFTAPADAVRRAKRWTLALSLLSAAALLVTGIANFEGSRVFYVIIPYVFMFLPAYLSVSASVKLQAVSDNMTENQADSTVIRLKHATLFLVILGVVSLVGDLCFILWGGCANPAGECGFLAACFIVVLLNSVLFYILSRNFCIIMRD